jgi:ribonuclease HI
MNSIFSIIKELEQKLHRIEVRKDLNQLKNLLHDSFKEIGSSGTLYTKEDILSRLPGESPRELSSSDFSGRDLSDNLYQLIYKTEGTLRSSLWILEGNKWQLIFHQGTRTSE